MEHLPRNQKPMTAITNSELTRMRMMKTQLPKIHLFEKNKITHKAL